MVEPSKGKWRALRIPLAFHRRWDKLEVWRHGLTLLAVLAAAVWLAASLLTAERGVTQYSPGPVSSVHAAWETQCSKCHADFAPQRAHAVSLSSREAAHQKWSRDADRQCRVCHPVDGLEARTRSRAEAYPIAQHSAHESPQAVAGCASCHREHPANGRAGSLIARDDRQCVDCHRDLQQIRVKSAERAAQCENRITQFDVDHPPFRSLQTAPDRAIKFSHARHMAPGLRSDGERSELPQLTLADLDPADQDRYRRTDQSNNQAIQLDCDSCHAPFKAMSASAGGGQSLASADDRHMSLPNYNQHCKACHPLDYKPGSPDKLVKHGMSAGELRTFLDEKYPADGPQGNDAFVEPSVAKRPLPGEPPSDAHDEKQRRALQASNRQRAESHLRNRCYECHQPKASGDAVLPDVQEVPWSKSPFTWLREAKFSHKVHAFARIDCQKCHESVETEGDWLAADKAIPDVDVCRECHAGKVDSPNVKAPFDCVTCHRYHRADGTDGHSPIAAVSAAADLERFQDAASLRTQFVALVDPPDANDFVGSISCAAGGCHGGKWNAAGDGDPAADESTWKMSYTTWMRRDPHADAYQALWSERSQRMVALLTARAPAPYEQVLHDRCIGCHSTAQHDDPAQRQWLADGVSCESCHGPAADWGLAHTLENWNPPNDHRDSSPGFVDTRNLEARAEKCVSCHVGQLGVGGIDSGQGGYEVNHDLIAAGHPRLNFEFAAYVENLPPHWNTKREAADHHPLDPNRWVVGQTVAARAALGQLAARAKAAATGESSTSVWPELAEYACDSCHHDLESPSYRQRHRTTAQLGQLTWGAWYFPVFERPGADAAQQPPIEPLSELREAMQAFVPNHGEVAKKCQALTLVDVDAGEATKKLRAAIRGTPRATWDDVAQWYLAAAALVAQLERDDAFAKDGAAAPAAKSENDAALAELHRTLEFPFVGSSARREFEGCYEAVDRLRELLSPWIEEDAAE